MPSVFKKVWAKDLPPPDGQTPVNPDTDPVAQALGYKPDVKDVNYQIYPQRKDPKAKNQFCGNCSRFTRLNPSWGKCEMITSGIVSAHGWCGSYDKKA